MSSSPNAAHVLTRAQPARRLPWVGNPQLLGRLAWSGLASVLLFLACFSVFVAASTHVAADGVRHSTNERNAFEAVRYDVAAEESLERKYRLQPSPEVREQQEHLRALGCDAGQGFLYARPAPTHEIEALLAARAELPRAA